MPIQKQWKLAWDSITIRWLNMSAIFSIYMIGNEGGKRREKKNVVQWVNAKSCLDLPFVSTLWSIHICSCSTIVCTVSYNDIHLTFDEAILFMLSITELLSILNETTCFGIEATESIVLAACEVHVIVYTPIEQVTIVVNNGAQCFCTHLVTHHQILHAHMHPHSQSYWQTLSQIK